MKKQVIKKQVENQDKRFRQLDTTKILNAIILKNLDCSMKGIVTR